MRRQPSVGSRAGWAKRRSILRSRFSAVVIVCWIAAVVLFFSRAGIGARPHSAPAQVADQPSNTATAVTVLSALHVAELRVLEPAEVAAAVQHLSGVPGTAADAAMAARALSRVAPIMAALRHAGETLTCEWDVTLPTEPSFPWGSKVLVAANLHDSGALMPHYTLQLLALLAALPRGSAFLSVYESGSTDDTGLWLEALASLVAALGVPHRVVANGGLVRAPGQDRIAFLAAARNAALEPLWAPASEPDSAGARADAGTTAARHAVAGQPSRRVHSQAHVGEAALVDSSGTSSLRSAQQAADSSAGSEAYPQASAPAERARRRGQLQQHARGLLEQPSITNATSETVTAASRVWRGGDDGPFRADRVLFLNDVFFCAAGAARLLRHDADLACGMDFDRPAIRQMSRQVQRRLYGEHLRNTYGIPEAVGRVLGRWTALLRRWRDAPAADAAHRLAAPLQFYDTWVARDADGDLFAKTAPYAQQAEDAARLRRGLPVPVRCCWNGAVALDAAPFLDGVRIRSHGVSECAASECSLLCNDVLRRGSDRFLMDPGVRLAYTGHEAGDLGRVDRVGLQNSSWADVSALPAIDWSRLRTAQQPQVKCCGLPQGKDSIDFDRDCHWEDVMMSS